MLKRSLAALSLLLFISFAATSAHACLCFPIKPRKALKEATTVFLGKVVEIKRDEEKPGELAVKFEVERYWKNVPGPYVTVFTTLPGGGSCGLRVVEGERYLIFAYGREKLNVSICSSRNVGRAGEVIKSLGKGRAVEISPRSIPPPPPDKGMRPTPLQEASPVRGLGARVIPALCRRAIRQLGVTE